MSKKAIAILAFISFTSFLSAKECSHDNEMKSLRKEFNALSRRIDAMEAQQKITLTNFKKDLDSNKADITALRKSIDANKNQACNVPKDLLDIIESLQRDVADSKELEKTLIEHGYASDGYSLLHNAVQKGDVYAVNLLISKRIDVNSDQSFTPLCMAAMFNQYEIAEILLNSGAEVNEVGKGNYYPFYYALKSGSIELVELFLEHGARLDSVKNEDTSKFVETPLHTACEVGNFDAVQALVRKGANINGKILSESKDSWRKGTPLDWAIFKLKCKDNPQNLDLIKFLVDNGAKRNVIYFYSSCSDGRDFVMCPIIYQYLNDMGIFSY